MKKLLVCAVFFFLVAGAAFAQLASGIWVNAWGRGTFVPLWYETPQMQYGKPVSTSEGILKNGTGVTWDPNNQPRVDFRVNAATDFVGFTIHVNSEYLTGTGNGDNGAQLWVKPFGNNWLKLTVANQFIEDALRGKVTTDTGFENFVLGKSMMKFTDGIEPLNQDVTFNRFGGGRGSVSSANAANTSTHISSESVLSNVFFLSSSPIDGLFIGLMLQGTFPDIDLKESWRQVHVGAGYEIPDIGHARAQYIGGFMGKEKDATDNFRLAEPSKFEAAFALSAVDNLKLDLGAKIWTPVEKFNGEKSYRGVDIAVGASYRYDSLNIAFMGQALYIGAYTGALTHSPTKGDKGANGVHLVFNLIPEYDFDFGTLGLSFIAQTKTADTGIYGEKAEKYSHPNVSATPTTPARPGVNFGVGPWTRFGVGAWYRKGLAGGYIKIGVAYAFPYIAIGSPSSTLVPGGYAPDPDQAGFNGRGILTIPIILEYAFF